MKNAAWEYIKSPEFKRARFKSLAWPMLIVGLALFWETEAEWKSFQGTQDG